MTVSGWVQSVLAGVAITALLLVGACAWRPAVPPWTGAEPYPVPVRFLLTFDDGPSGALSDNPTASILAQLADNPIQPRIKALFFVQTRNAEGGASAVGRGLLQRLHAEGHLLGLHRIRPHPQPFPRLQGKGVPSPVIGRGLG